jgi:hypothetical protein
MSKQEEKIVDSIDELVAVIADTNQQLTELVATLDNLTRWYMEVNGYNTKQNKDYGKKKQ